MPNTLGHIGVQLPLSRLLFKNVETPWIITGLLIPDLPWILQRVIRPFQLFETHDLKLFVSVQASLLFCLLLGGALSCFSRRPLIVFGALAFNSTLHLLLDAAQIKWGIGVHLFAPFSWSLTSYGIFWPEDSISYMLTGLGLLCIAFVWKKSISTGIELIWPRGKYIAVTLTCLFLYFLTPLFLVNSLEESNYAYIKIQRQPELRPGQTVILDRAPYSHNTHALSLNTGEEIQLQGKLPEKSSQISIKGTFITEKVITIKDLHEHITYRDWASRLGLILTGALCALSWISFLRKKT